MPASFEPHLDRARLSVERERIGSERLAAGQRYASLQLVSPEEFGRVRTSIEHMGTWL